LFDGYENVAKNVPSLTTSFWKLHLWCQKNTRICNNSQRFSLESDKCASVH